MKLKIHLFNNAELEITLTTFANVSEIVEAFGSEEEILQHYKAEMEICLLKLDSFERVKRNYETNFETRLHEDYRMLTIESLLA